MLKTLNQVGECVCPEIYLYAFKPSSCTQKAFTVPMNSPQLVSLPLISSQMIHTLT